ncbi:Hypothetical predicted protein [Octopus vulgaris]|uniref:Uncharacterized protein n=1 Tax=Octopus vulgaris TaxID=6645 RepID=A0AA36FKD5_OCTVU|nr:Hypothetical predicted protein [Octopus vulgaris]
MLWRCATRSRESLSIHTENLLGSTGLVFRSDGDGIYDGNVLGESDCDGMVGQSAEMRTDKTVAMWIRKAKGGGGGGSGCGGGCGCGGGGGYILRAECWSRAGHMLVTR